MVGLYIHVEANSNKLAMVLELAPNLVTYRAMEAGEEPDPWSAAPSLVNFFQWMDMDKVSKVGTNDDAVAPGRHQRLKVSDRIPLHVHNVKGEFYRFVKRCSTRGSQADLVTRGGCQLG